MIMQKRDIVEIVDTPLKPTQTKTKPANQGVNFTNSLLAAFVLIFFFQTITKQSCN